MSIGSPFNKINELYTSGTVIKILDTREKVLVVKLPQKLKKLPASSGPY